MLNRMAPSDAIKLLKICSPPILILAIHSFAGLRKMYDQIWWLDLVMHFGGGALLAFSMSFLLILFKQWGLLNWKNKWILFIMVICVVGLATGMWELIEYSADTIFEIEAQKSLRDTMGDIFLGDLGAIFGFCMYIFAAKTPFGKFFQK